MGLDVGRNSGITGIVDFPTNNTTTQFAFSVLMWQNEDRASSVDNTGTGDGNQGNSLTLIENWSLLLRGRVERSQWPQPTTLQNAVGDIRLTFNQQGNDPTKNQAMEGTIRVTGVKYSYDKEDDALWNVALTADWIGSPEFLNWPGAQPNPSAMAAGRKYLYAGRRKVVDPNNLIDYSVQRINVWGITPDTDAAEVTAITNTMAAFSTPPQTGEQQYTATGEKLASGIMRITIVWREKTTVQEVTFPSTSSTRSSQNPYTDSTASVITSGTLNAATSSNIIWNASQNQPYIYGVNVHQLTPTKQKVTITYQNPGIYYKGRGKGSQKVFTRVVAGAIQVYLAWNKKAGTGQQWVQASLTDNIDYGREILDYTVVRRVTDNTVPRQNPNTIGGVTMPHYYTINNASFLGNSSYTTMYTGVSFAFRAQNDTSSTSILCGYDFHHDSGTIVLGAADITMNQPILLTTTETRSGWVTASTLGGPFASLFIPPAESFTAFTSGAT